MSSTNSAELKSALAGTKGVMLIKDQPVALRLKYHGTGTVTSVTVTTATQVVLITSDGGTETFTWANFSTAGALVDAINGSSVWQAKILDAKRDDTMTSTLVTGAITLSTGAFDGTLGYYDLVWDTSATKSLTFRCSYDRNVGKDVPAGGHRVKLQEFTYYATLGNASANDVQIWEYNPADKTETQVYQALSVSAAVTTTSFASGRRTLDSGWGRDLIVRLVDDTSLSDTNAVMQLAYIRE